MSKYLDLVFKNTCKKETKFEIELRLKLDKDRSLDQIEGVAFGLDL